MKTNRRKCFTLVELLVVIAILAILATVSVVGYTSFIERAYVSNDTNMASQLNQYLIAYQADHTSKHYGQDITPDNIREVTQEILKNGLDGKLKPHAVDYGYHYYYDFVDKKYVVARFGNDGLFEVLAHADDNNGKASYLGSCFTEDGRYFLVDTEGSDLADIVNGLYTAKTTEDIKNVIDKANALVDEPAQVIENVKNYVNNTNVIIDGTQYLTGNAPSSVVVTDGTVKIENNIVVVNGGEATTVIVAPAGSTVVVTIPESVKYIQEGALNTDGDVVIVINKPASEVAGMADGGFTNAKLELDGEDYTADADKITNADGSVEHPFSYENELVSFDIYVNDANNIKNIYEADGKNTNSAYVAWELDEFELVLDTVGEDATTPATGIDMTWTANSDAVTFVGNTVKFDRTKTPADEIVITGSNGKGVTQTFTIKVGKTTAATVELAKKLLNTTPTIYLVHGGKSNVHEIELGELTYNTAGSNLTLDTALDVAYVGTGLTETDNVLTTSGNGEGTLTINVGKYLTYTVKVVVFDKSALPIEALTNTVVLGQGSKTAPVYINDLFAVKDATKIPADAEVRFTNVYADDEYVAFDRTYIDYVKDTSDNAITSLAWSNTTGFYFSEVSGATTISIAVYSADGTRISDDVTVKVINATNVRTWNEIKNGISADTVLLKDIVFDNDAQLAVTGGTFYGNDYVLDVRNAKKDAAEHIIKLTNATLDGLNIVGKVYSTFTYQDHYSSGKLDSTSIVVSDNSTIRNCYIANGRSPIRVKGNTRVEDSVIFGGKFCNIDVAKGVLTLAGDVTTINQIYEGTIGAGIVCDLTRDTNYVTMTDDCNLVQYNFIPKTAGSALPTVQITITLDLWITTVSGSIAVKMGTMVTSLIGDVNNTYDNWVYETKDANQNVTESYLNAGIVYLAATGDGASLVSKDNKSSGKWPDGYELATYTETYHPGDDKWGLETKAHAYVYSPAKTNSANIDFENTWFKNATDAKYMEQYLPTNYVTGAMK